MQQDILYHHSKRLKIFFLSNSSVKPDYIIEELKSVGLKFEYPLGDLCYKFTSESDSVLFLKEHSHKFQELSALFIDLDCFKPHQYFSLLLQYTRLIELSGIHNLVVFFIINSMFFQKEPLRDFINFKKWNNVYDFAVIPFERKPFFIRLYGYLQYQALVRDKLNKIAYLENFIKKNANNFSPSIDINQEMDTITKREGIVLFVELYALAHYFNDRTPEELLILLNKIFTSIIDVIFKFKGVFCKSMNNTVVIFLILLMKLCLQLLNMLLLW